MKPLRLPFSPFCNGSDYLEANLDVQGVLRVHLTVMFCPGWLGVCHLHVLGAGVFWVSRNEHCALCSLCTH
jgi:hypothetical protein